MFSRSLLISLLAMLYSITSHADLEIYPAKGEPGISAGPGKVELIRPMMAFPEIYVSGDMSMELVDKLRHIAISAKPNTSDFGLIYLDSVGGNYNSGLAMGKLIYDLGYSTKIGKRTDHQDSGAAQCRSACTDAFLGGRFRYMDEGSKIGFHRIYSDQETYTADDFAQAQIATAKHAEYLRKMGVSPDLLGLMVKKGRNDFEFLSTDQATQLNVIDSGAKSPTWIIEGEGGAVELIGTQVRDIGFIQLTASCHPGQKVLLTSTASPAAFAIPVGSAPTTLTFLVDDHPLNTYKMKSAGTTLQHSLSLSFIPQADALNKLSHSSSIGISIDYPNKNTPLTLTLNSVHARKKMSSFFKLCTVLGT
jgi:hypothetical protein